MYDYDGLSSLIIQGLSTGRRDTAAGASPPIIKYPLVSRRMEPDSCPRHRRQDSRPAADMQHPAPSLVMVDYDSSF